MAARRHIPFDHEEPLPGETPPPFPRVKPAKGEPLWVFGYGSLMWDPGFPHTSVTVAKLWGHHRGFCIWRSEEHTSELQSLMRISYAVFCLKKKNKTKYNAL